MECDIQTKEFNLDTKEMLQLTQGKSVYHCQRVQEPTGCPHWCVRTIRTGCKETGEIGSGFSSGPIQGSTACGLWSERDEDSLGQVPCASHDDFCDLCHLSSAVWRMNVHKCLLHSKHPVTVSWAIARAKKENLTKKKKMYSHIFEQHREWLRGKASQPDRPGLKSQLRCYC